VTEKQAFPETMTQPFARKKLTGSAVIAKAVDLQFDDLKRAYEEAQRPMTRRDYIQILSAGAALAGAATNLRAAEAGEATRDRRMKWWHEARFGMFIHWGVYSGIARHGWVMENEAIPAEEYEQYAKNSKPSRTPRVRGRNWLSNLSGARGRKVR
jgi:Alpha-L-fucosidase